MANTGRKLTIVVIIAVAIAPDTSLTALYISPASAFPFVIPRFSGISIYRMMLSTNTTPTSTITPMAMAIPDRATMFASIPVYRININVASTAMGSMLAITTDARRLSTSTIITMIQISISCERLDSSVPIVSLISPVRS